MPAILGELLDTVLASGYCNVPTRSTSGYFHPLPLAQRRGARRRRGRAAQSEPARLALRRRLSPALECEALGFWLATFTGLGPPIAAAASLPGGVFTLNCNLRQPPPPPRARHRPRTRGQQTQGMPASSPVAVYMSAAAHFSVIKVLDALGLGAGPAQHRHRTPGDAWPPPPPGARRRRRCHPAVRDWPGRGHGHGRGGARFPDDLA